MSEMQRTKIDPELLRQLASTSPVQAVFKLRSADPCRRAPSPEETESTARDLLVRVQESVGIAPRAVNIFRNLGYFVVDADATFVRRLTEQAEVLTALPNRRGVSGR